MSGSIGNRKTDHLTLCATGDVGFRLGSTLFESVRFIHDALPELHVDEIDMSCILFGKRLRAPILIAAMTGGTDEAGKFNRELAAIAEERGYGFGLGSQRAMHIKGRQDSTYDVRERAPSVLLLGNLGVVQARDMKTEEVQHLVDAVKADALCIHLNPAMELVQPGGDRDFRGCVDTIKRLVKEINVPVVVKETGCGLSTALGRRLQCVGVKHVDVSGAGGTSWVGVETKRAQEQGDRRGEALGEAFWDWGIPTAASVASLKPLGFETIIATGGIASGLDVAKAVALGATAAGIARPVLKAFHSGGRAEALTFLDIVENQLRAALLLTGSRNLAALREKPCILGDELRRWVEQSSSPTAHA